MKSPCSICVCISFNLLSQVNSFKEMGMKIMTLHPHQQHTLLLPTVSNSNTAHIYIHTHTHTPLHNMNFTHSSRGNPCMCQGQQDARL
jgi:predicted phosphodiesterase